MVPGTPSTIICAHCGWQNDSNARMCGGCGMPLRSTDPGATSQDNTGPGGWGPAQGNLVSQDAPTVMSPGGNVAPQAYVQPATPPPVPQMPTPVTAMGQAAAWPAAGKAKPATGRFRWWIIPVAILITLIVLGLLGLGVWGLGIQPSTTHSVNTTFPTVLDSAFSQVNASLKPDHSGQVQISAATLDALIKAKSPSSGPVTAIDFNYISLPSAGIKLTYNFNFFGTEVQNTTAEFSIESGHLAARSTTVDGSMSLFESGDQMEQYLNNALGSLTAIQGKVESFQLHGDILQIQLVKS
jgi:hypothetical protein